MQLSKFLKLNKLIFVFFPQLWISNLAISVLIVVLSLQLRLAWDWNYLHFFFVDEANRIWTIYSC